MKTMQQYKHESYALGFVVNDPDIIAADPMKHWRRAAQLERDRMAADLLKRAFGE